MEAEGQGNMSLQARADAIVAGFTKCAEGEILRIDALCLNGKIPVDEAGCLRAELTKTVGAWREELEACVPRYAREKKPFSNLRDRAEATRDLTEIVKSASSKAREDKLLQCELDILGMAAIKASRDLSQLPPPELPLGRWLVVGKLILLTLASYLVLCGLDGIIQGEIESGKIEQSTVQKSHMDTKNGPLVEDSLVSKWEKIEPKAAFRKPDKAHDEQIIQSGQSSQPGGFMEKCNGKRERLIVTESPPKSKNIAKGAPVAHIQEESKCVESLNEYSSKNTPDSCAIPSLFKRSFSSEGAAQKVALKTLAMIFNILFVVGLTGSILAFLRAFGMGLADKIFDNLVDSIMKPGSGGGAASGISSLLSAQGLLGVGVAAVIGVAAVNSVSVTKESSSELKNQIEKYLKETVAPPMEEQKALAVALTQTVVDLKDAVGALKGAEPKISPPLQVEIKPLNIRVTIGNNNPAAGGKTAEQVGKEIGTAIIGKLEPIGTGFACATQRVEALEKSRLCTSKELAESRKQLLTLCMALNDLEKAAKNDVGILREKMVMSGLPENPEYALEKLQLVCPQVVAEGLCSNQAPNCQVKSPAGT